MKIIDERIVEATEKEIYKYWLSRDWCNFYSFYDFLEKMKEAGCTVLDEEKNG